jgi:hypothetical protein
MPSSVINSDDGVISGTSGIKTTGGDDGSLKIQNNGTDAVTVASDGDVTLAADLSVTSNLLFNSGYGSVATAYGCRAWVNFNGTGTPAVNASGNVSSVTRASGFANGVYIINFTTAMPDSNYAAVAASSNDVVTRVDGYDTTSVRLVVNATSTNPTTASVAVFR